MWGVTMWKRWVCESCGYCGCCCGCPGNYPGDGGDDDGDDP